MATTSPQDYTQNVLYISNEMYRHAKQGDWDTFVKLEAQRQKIINSLFRHPQIKIELENLALMLKQVIVIDNKSLALGEKEKQHLAEKMTGLKQHQQAAKIYQNISMN